MCFVLYVFGVVFCRIKLANGSPNRIDCRFKQFSSNTRIDLISKVNPSFTPRSGFGEECLRTH